MYESCFSTFINSDHGVTCDMYNITVIYLVYTYDIGELDMELYGHIQALFVLISHSTINSGPISWALHRQAKEPPEGL